MSETTTLLVAVALGYLLGSIPFGLVLTKAAGFGDIRAIGSGNIGATNVLRTGSKTLALAVLLLDGVKGAVAVWLAAALWGQPAYFLAGVGAVYGHLLPIWLSPNVRGVIALSLIVAAIAIALWQPSGLGHVLGVIILLVLAVVAWGGKGVATTLGVMIAVLPLVGALAVLTWLAAAFVSKRSSIGALTAVVAAPIYCLLLPLAINPTVQPFDWHRAAFASFLALVVILRHRDNILRLARGEEPRISFKGQARI